LERPTQKPPKPATIRLHAQALKSVPEELLLGVPTDYDRLRWPDLTEPQLEVLLAGLQKMPTEQRTAILRTCTTVVKALPDPLIPAATRLTRVSKLGTAEKEAKTHQRKRRA